MVVYYVYDRDRGALQDHIDGYNLLVWFPLFLGAHYAAVGFFYTAPGAIDPSQMKSYHLLYRIVSHPFAINTITLGVPAIILAGMIPCAVFSQRALSHNYRDYLAFSQRVHETVTASGPVITAGQAQMYLAQASDIWNNLAKGQWWLSIGYAIWTASCSIVLICFFPAGGNMLRILWNQMQEQRRVIEKMVQQQIDMAEADRLAAEQMAAVMSRERRAQMVHALVFRPGKLQSATMDDSDPEKQDGDGSGDDKTDEELSPTSSGEAQGASDDVFFPPLRQPPSSRAQKRAFQDAPPVAKFKYLRRCFWSLLVLYIGINVAAALYTAIGARLASGLYTSFLVGPEAVADLVMTSHIPTSWAAVFFGCLTLGAIFFRFLDGSHQDEAITTRPTTMASQAPASGFGTQSRRVASAFADSVNQVETTVSTGEPFSTNSIDASLPSPSEARGVKFEPKRRFEKPKNLAITPFARASHTCSFDMSPTEERAIAWTHTRPWYQNRRPEAIDTSLDAAAQMSPNERYQNSMSSPLLQFSPDRMSASNSGFSTPTFAPTSPRQAVVRSSSQAHAAAQGTAGSSSPVRANSQPSPPTSPPRSDFQGLTPRPPTPRSAASSTSRPSTPQQSSGSGAAAGGSNTLPTASSLRRIASIGRDCDEADLTGPHDDTSAGESSANQQ